MPELTHDTADDGFHEIQLSGKQLVFLFMATTVVSVVIFLCGVMVGRGVRAERGEEPIDSPVAATATPSAGEEAVAPPATEPPAPPAEDELSYHRRLQGSAAQEELKTKPAEEPAPAPPQAAAATAKPAPAASGPDVPTSGRAGAWVVQVHALKDRGVAAALVQRLIDRGYPAFLQTPAAGAPAIYRVRIGRFGDRGEAEQTARRLQKEEQLTPVVTR